jgi:hypothetical protein
MKLIVQENTLHMVPASNTHNHLTFLLPIQDVRIETESSQLTFKITFYNKF